MSAIYFHSEREETLVRGSERAHAGLMCSDLFAMVLGVGRYLNAEDWTRLVSLFPPDHYLRGMPEINVKSLRAALAVSDEMFLPQLNTAWALGSDAVRLLARLHGQCEIHAYVLGHDRAWLAGLIEDGRASGVLRADMGWEKVATMLRSANDAPVVTSYSVCDQFPNSHVAEWEGDDDAWYELPESERWRLALAGLYKDEGLRMNPADWASFYFGDGTTAYDLLDTSRTSDAEHRGEE